MALGRIALVSIKGIIREIEREIAGVMSISLENAVEDKLLELKAYGGTEQRNLPSGYTQVEYIDINANSYLLTDVIPTYDCKVEFDFQPRRLPSATSQFLGGRTKTFGGLFFVRTSDNVFMVDAFGNSTNDRYTSNVSVTANTRYKFIYDNKVSSVISNGETLFTNTSTGTEANGAAIAINGLNNNGTLTISTTEIYVYSFKVWNGQGVLVANYIPCVYNNAVGFYDTVSESFKGATAGTFTAGPDAVPTPDEPMDIVSNNGAIKLRRQSGLPINYQMVEWIKPSGSIVITDFKTKSTQEITTVFYRETSGNTYLYATDTATSGTTNTTAYITSGGGNWRWDGKALSVSISLRTEVTSVQSADGLSFNGSKYGSYGDPGEFVSTNDLRISSNENTTVRIYSMTIREGETVTLDLVPVQRLSDSAYGFYDKVSGNLYTNAEATFTAGDPIADPIEIYTDGEAEVLTVNGQNLVDLTAVTNDYYYNQNGVYTATENARLSDFIPVKAGQKYTAYVVKRGSAFAFNIRVNLFSTDRVWLSQSATPVTQPSVIVITPPEDGYLRLSANYKGTDPTSSWADWSTLQIVVGEYTLETMPPYQPYVQPQTVTDIPMLLGVGDYKDEAELISGLLTHNVGIKVLDGTETRVKSGNLFYSEIATDALEATHICYCTHFQGIATNESATYDNKIKVGTNATQTINWVRIQLYPTVGTFADADVVKQWLSNQYNAGTPVIVIYPLATPTTESITGQTMNIPAGNSTIEITQASLNTLELSAKYKALP